MSVVHRPGLADHWGVEVVLGLDVARLELPPRPPRTHWKLNSSITEHESFLPQFTTLFHQLEEDIEAFEDEADWWDEFAKTSFLQIFSVSLAKQRKSFKAFLLALLRVATVKEEWQLVAQTKEKLNGIVKHNAFGLIIRSRDNQNAEEEEVSLYHYKKTKKEA